MFKGVLYAPMRFFESQPVGRVLNRFAKDQSTIDDLFPATLFDFLQCATMTLGSLAIIAVANPWPLLILLLAVPTFLWIRRRFVAASREIKRLEAMTRSPVYSLFSQSLSGLITIRAFDMPAAFSVKFSRTFDVNNRALMGFIFCNRWFGYRLDLICVGVIFATSFSTVLVRSVASAGSSSGGTYGATLTPAQVGLSLCYALQVTGLFQWCVRQSAEVENQLTSVERICEYGAIKPEGLRRSANPPPADWPSKGAIEFNGTQLRYRENLDLVLRDLTVSIAPQHKVGVCGRTGAGKSSLLTTLFRLVEPCGGTIHIDGVDIASLGLAELRSKMAIIPQEPVIFSGTLRYNLDPFKQHSDDKIWEALDAVQLRTLVTSHAEGLAMPLAEFGGNLSAGEAQLICVARALLKPSRVLLVDEATANVDGETDALIQDVIRTRFADRTVLTVAHRIATIMDSNNILALEKGRVSQYGPPQQLLQQPGLFCELATESGLGQK
jgi:ABC-type multidrug transport system fused ATPase/permease subunit